MYYDLTKNLDLVSLYESARRRDDEGISDWVKRMDSTINTIDTAYSSSTRDDRLMDSFMRLAAGTDENNQDRFDYITDPDIRELRIALTICIALA